MPGGMTTAGLQQAANQRAAGMQVGGGFTAAGGQMIGGKNSGGTPAGFAGSPEIGASAKAPRAAVNSAIRQGGGFTPAGGQMIGGGNSGGLTHTGAPAIGIGSYGSLTPTSLQQMAKNIGNWAKSPQDAIAMAARNFGFGGAPQLGGILGRFGVESLFNPDALNKKEKSYGLGQWRGSRLTNLQNYAMQMGLPVNNPTLQTAFFNQEMRSPMNRGAYNGLMNAQTPQQGIAAMNAFERPQGYVGGGKPQFNGVTGSNMAMNYANQYAGLNGMPEGTAMASLGNTMPAQSRPQGVMPQVDANAVMAQINALKQQGGPLPTSGIPGMASAGLVPHATPDVVNPATFNERMAAMANQPPVGFAQQAPQFQGQAPGMASAGLVPHGMPSSVNPITSNERQIAFANEPPPDFARQQMNFGAPGFGQLAANPPYDTSKFGPSRMQMPQFAGNMVGGAFGQLSQPPSQEVMSALKGDRMPGMSVSPGNPMANFAGNRVPPGAFGQQAQPPTQAGMFGNLFGPPTPNNNPFGFAPFSNIPDKRDRMGRPPDLPNAFPLGGPGTFPVGSMPPAQNVTPASPSLNSYPPLASENHMKIMELMQQIQEPRMLAPQDNYNPNASQQYAGQPQNLVPQSAPKPLMTPGQEGQSVDLLQKVRDFITNANSGGRTMGGYTNTGGKPELITPRKGKGGKKSTAPGVTPSGAPGLHDISWPMLALLNRPYTPPGWLNRIG